MQITTEAIQRWIRIGLHYGFGAATMYGFIAPTATWEQSATAIACEVAAILWSIYGNRIQAKINEVAKLDVVASVKVNSVSVAVAAPDNVTPAPTATP